jgi:hypothetical protein
MYDLSDELSVVGHHQNDGPKRNEKVYPECTSALIYSIARCSMKAADPDHVLRAPCLKVYKPDAQLRMRVAVYLGIVVGRRREEVALHLPENMPVWGKLRIRHGGDAIRSTFAARRNRATPQRDSSCIRVRTCLSCEMC